MQIALGAGMLFLIASVFLTYLWLTTERWIMGYDYLAWILGFWVTGIVLLLITRRGWRQKRFGSHLLRMIIFLVVCFVLLYGVAIYQIASVLRGWQ
jgi:hypothetical protein